MKILNFIRVLAAIAGVLLLFAVTSCQKSSPESDSGLDGSSDTLKKPLPKDDPEYHSVTNRFGPLYVLEGVSERQVDVTPWASYYYASNDDLLFKDPTDSAMAKYDQYVAATGRVPTHAREEELQNWQDHGRGAPSWLGLCNAWSYASLLLPEPIGRTVHGVTFTTGDLKGLLLKTFEKSVPPSHYGQQYQEAPGYDINDIYPEEFQRFLQVQVFDGGKPFVMDADPGQEVWNYPVYYAKSEIKADATDPTLMQVHTLLLAGRMLKADQAELRTGDLPIKYDAFDYTYVLHGTKQADGRFKVVWGDWTGQSTNWHPDYVIPMPQALRRAAVNSQISPDVVDEILAAPLTSI